MKALYIPFALIILLTVATAYTNSPLTMPGYNQSGYDTNLKGWAIWNGSINGTNFNQCDTSLYASAWNGSGFECVTKGGVETDPIAEASKVNRAGDNITGGLYIRVDNSQQELQSDITGLTNDNVGLVMVNNDTWQTFSMFTFANYTLGGTFGGHMSRYNSTTKTKYPLLSGDAPFYFFMKGWDGSVWAASSARFYMETAGNWNSTNHPAQIRMMTQEGNAVQHFTTFTSSGSIKSDALAGVGNAYLCLDATGTRYRGSPTC